MWSEFGPVNGQKASASDPIENGDKPVEVSKAPGVRNTLVAFFRFFHFARRFWNHTCQHIVMHMLKDNENRNAKMEFFFKYNTIRTIARNCGDQLGYYWRGPYSTRVKIYTCVSFV